MYNTLWQVYQHLENCYGLVVSLPDAVNYLQTATRHYNLNGEWLHVIITRLESGRYELVSYVL